MPRLTLDGHTVRLTPREWATLADLARLTAGQPTRGVLAKDCWPDTSARDRTRRRLFQDLATKGLLTRRADGWTLPADVRMQIMGLGLPTGTAKGGSEDDPRQLRLV